MAKKFYAVQRGRAPGIYLTWADCEQQVKGFSGAVYKSFPTKEEAQAFLGDDKVVINEPTGDSKSAGRSGATSVKGTPSTAKNTSSNTGTVMDVLQSTITEGALVAYIDGSFNKHLGSVGAGGVMFYNDKQIPFSFGTKEPMYTEFWNVSGELLASMHVLQYAVDHGIAECHLYYDYMGIEMWATKKWKRNNRLTQAYAAFCDTVLPQVRVHFHKVAAHTGDTYNEMADQLAKQGTMKA